MCISSLTRMMILRSESNILYKSSDSAELGWSRSMMSGSHYRAPKSRFSSALSITAAATMSGILLLSNTSLAQDASLIQQEIQKRQESVILAEELLLKGDKFYTKGNYAKAVDVYSKAFEMIPKGGLTNEIKQASAERYAQAVVENAKSLNRVGRSAEAKRQLEAILSPEVLPGNTGAKKMLDKLDDPIRSSPTLTPEHVNDVVQVGQLLRKGEAYYLQGQYNESVVAYKEVLKLDPYNKAARRGMEKTMGEMSHSYTTGRDQNRAQALQDVDALWERKVEEEVNSIVSAGTSEEQQIAEDQITRNNKVAQIMVPEVNFQNTTFDDALRIIRALTRELDTTELDPALKGVNYVTRFGDEAGGFAPKIRATRFSLQLRSIPMSEVLDRVTQATGTYWRAERHAIVIRPLGSESGDLEERTFRVPVGFLDNAGDNQQQEDVFANSQSGLQAQMTALEYFKKLGIAFPEGAYAFYTSNNNTLRVKNTPLALDSIETFVRAQAMKEKVQVVLKVTIMEIGQTDLTELGYDWLIDPTKAGRVSVGGGTVGNQASPLTPIAGAIPGITFAGQPLNNGNRSGDTAFGQGGISNLIADSQNSSGVASVLPSRAPGVLQVSGTISDTNYQMILRGVKQKNDNSQIWVPSVVTAPGQKATIYSGRDFIYPEEYEPGEVPNTVETGNGAASPVTPPTPTSFTTKQLGMLLEVEPTVSDDKNYIDLSINPNLSSFEGFVNYGSPIQTAQIDPITGLVTPQVISRNEILMPVFRVIRTNTNVTIQDGHTLVIGGLKEHRVETVNDKTPILGNIPMIGRFFQSDALRSTKTAIVIFVKAELVDPTGRPWRDR